MKYLINQNFKPLRKGDFVSANTDSGEFIYSTIEETSKSTLVGILEVNAKSKLNGDDSIKSLTEKVNSTLSKLKIPEVNEMPQSEKVLETVKAAHIEGLDNDAIMIKVMQLGIGYKKAVKAFENAMKEIGAMISTGDRVEQGNKLLKAGKFNTMTGGKKPELKEFSYVQDFIDKIVKEVADTNSAQALGIVRKYAKSQDMEMPKKPKSAGGGKRAKELEKLVHWILDNFEDATEDTYRSFCEEQEIGQGRTNAMLKIMTCIKSYKPKEEEEEE